MSPSDLARRRAEAQRRNPGKTPKTIAYQHIDFDVLDTLVSFYVRTVNGLVSQDLDAHTESLNLAGGTGKISTILMVDSNPVAALLHETLSPGINLTWMLNAHWMIPVDSDRACDPDVCGAVAAAVAAAEAPAPGVDRFLFVPSGLAEEALGLAGFEEVARWNTYVLNRTGLHRYYEYIAGRYGEIGARFAKKRALRSTG